jgi:hypothetical protein
MVNKKYQLGQYFTRKEIVNRVLKLLLMYKPYQKNIKILEPSFGSGNFISELKHNGFKNIEKYEIDPELTRTPKDFFEAKIEKKFDLIIGNPPFTKYNLKESYYYPKKYFLTGVNPHKYLTAKLIKKGKLKIENAFILKAIRQLKNKDSTIGFVLPISFFIKNKNVEVKREIVERFSTIIIYQTDENFVDDPIPCCFAIFTNTEQFKNKVVLIYEGSENVNETVNKEQLLTEELIPKSFFYKKNVNHTGIPLSTFLLDKSVKYKLSFKDNNVSGSNILERVKIPVRSNVADYSLAIVRVGNSSVGKAGFVNVDKDILNGMFYVFRFKDKYNNNRKLKEKIVELINQNQTYFKNITYRVGSKSIKRAEVLEFKVSL